MTRNVPAHDLNEDRIRDLRRVRDRIDRDEAKAPWVLQPARRDWLRNHGLIDVAKTSARSTPEERRCAITVTPLGLRVLELWGQRVTVDSWAGPLAGTVVGVRLNGIAYIGVAGRGMTHWWEIRRVSLASEQQEGARP